MSKQDIIPMTNFSLFDRGYAPLTPPRSCSENVQSITSRKSTPHLLDTTNIIFQYREPFDINTVIKIGKYNKHLCYNSSIKLKTSSCKIQQ